MKLNIISGGLDKIKTDALILFVYEKDNFSSDVEIVNNYLGNIFNKIAKKKYFNAEKSQIYSIDTHGKIYADNVILVGLGEKKKSSKENLRRRVAESLKFAQASSVKKCVLVLPQKNEEVISDIATIVGLTLYGFHNYKTKELNKIKKIETVEIYYPSNNKIDINKSSQIAEAVNWSRDLINHPGNHITPSSLANYAKKLASSKVNVKVFGKDKITKEKMGLILGVSQGSNEPPRFIILDYRPQKYSQTLVLVGKGLTFDSGGISIKPSERMDEMKMDMAGAAVVMGVFKAINVTKPNIRVLGLIPATENLPSGKALKPGDIIKSYSGQTVEIINTDAEGRLVLADALSYAKKYKPDLVIDIATLTGACVVALGDEIAGILGNNQKHIDTLKVSAQKTGEKVWQLPISDEHGEMMRSEIADIKNSSGSKSAGTITGAVFLENFIGDYPWIHIDIAGTAFDSKKPIPYNPKGATGYGVRLLIDIIDSWSNNNEH